MITFKITDIRLAPDGKKKQVLFDIFYTDVTGFTRNIKSDSLLVPRNASEAKIESEAQKLLQKYNDGLVRKLQESDGLEDINAQREELTGKEIKSND